MRARSLSDPELIWCRDIIERQSYQLTRLVDDLLDVSRISRGKVRLRFEPVELSAVLRGAVETSQPIVDAQRHELRISQPLQPVTVNGDPARLVQVVANLINNSAKYQEAGGKIEIAVIAERGVARITISDQGFGIDEGLLPRVFEPFTQGNPALDRTQGGLGIGLYLVKNIVDLHGGSVTAASAGSGSGATFTVDLPLMQQSPRAESEVPAARTRAGRVTPGARGGRQCRRRRQPRRPAQRSTAIEAVLAADGPAALRDGGEESTRRRAPRYRPAGNGWLRGLSPAAPAGA